MSLQVIFGGTFNPFHIGHYEMLAALDRMPDVSSVLVMPDRIPPHKTCDYLAPDEDRIEMCRIAADDFRKAQLCLIEFERSGKSYTYDTVLELKKRCPGKRFYMACGGDMIATLDHWYHWRELIDEIGFIAFRRVNSDGFDENVDRLRAAGADIRVCEAFISPVSSSALREALGRGEATGLIPERIYAYINTKGLYHGIYHS